MGDSITSVPTAARTPRGGAVLQKGIPQRAAEDLPMTAGDSYHPAAHVAAEIRDNAKEAMHRVDDHLGRYGFGVADPFIRPVLKVYAAIIGGAYGLGKSLLGK